MNPQTVESQVEATQPVLFDFFPQIPVVVQPTAGQLTSDAGLLPIRQLINVGRPLARLRRGHSYICFPRSGIGIFFSP